MVPGLRGVGFGQMIGTASVLFDIFPEVLFNNSGFSDLMFPFGSVFIKSMMIRSYLSNGFLSQVVSYYCVLIALSLHYLGSSCQADRFFLPHLIPNLLSGSFTMDSVPFGSCRGGQVSFTKVEA